MATYTATRSNVIIEWNNNSGAVVAFIPTDKTTDQTSAVYDMTAAVANEFGRPVSGVRARGFAYRKGFYGLKFSI